MKIIVAEKIAPAAIELFRQESSWNVVTPDQVASRDQLTAHLVDADALIVRSAVFVDAALLENAPKLRVIGRAGVGVDNIQLDAATAHGIAVMNTPGGNAIAVAEHTIGLMLSLARFIPRASEGMHAGKWEKKSLQGTELRNKTLGIIGLGRIGMEVARRAAAFGMKLVGHDPFVSPSIAKEAKITLLSREEVFASLAFVSPSIAKEAKITLLSREEVFASADYLTLHVGLTPQTANMINASSIAAMKKGVRIVNCARGELIDEAALVEALKAGHVAGAAIDVFPKEPPKESALLGLPGVVLTPHIGGSTNEAQDAVGVQIAQQVKDFLLRGVVQNAVNMPSMTEEEFATLEPFINLGEKLGSFLVQLAEGRVQEIAVRYTGAISEWKTDLIRNSVVKGVLQHATDESVNVINATSVAESKGIPVHEFKKTEAPAGGAANVLSVTLQTDAGSLLVRGTVLHRSIPRLLALDGMDIEAPLEMTLIVLRNRDVRGVVGRFGTILGEMGVNIANLTLGRARGVTGGTALAVVQVDGDVSEEVLVRLRAAQDVLSAKAVRL